MNNLIIEATKYTPAINLNAQTGHIKMEGKSYPENTFEFYEPIMSWMKEYFSRPQIKTIVELEIIYFNSSSSKLFFDFFDLIEENRDKSDIEIRWIYDKENESALEAGEDFKEDFESLNFNLLSK
ncbi:DUF1987 domain-containing protein [Candidatus Marinarcus aquaticus]|uniref:SiaC family regulatory phosphoprotein domain-containing protein n=1 Tax=Candidatus Marinarcus aquaticus TaxID=2044504 RepID=A0A4Q0XRL4_9BACT|nr:DUF1987 domain-containing protein [Candidatus Marinarcus aquaticus]RXJ57915.1 hypothetical protein CRV04_05255 [Candidatus Marinarcus aquaticus]